MPGSGAAVRVRPEDASQRLRHAGSQAVPARVEIVQGNELQTPATARHQIGRQRRLPGPRTTVDQRERPRRGTELSVEPIGRTGERRREIHVSA